jgi:hypothetical protein
MNGDESILLLKRLISRSKYLGEYKNENDYIINTLCLSLSIMLTNDFKCNDNKIENIIDKIKENINKIDWHPDRIEINSYKYWLENHKKIPRGILSPEEVFDFDYPNKAPISDDDGITLFTHAGGSEYFIPWYRLKDPIDALLLIHHLCDKCWIHRHNIKFLISECGKKFDWGYLGKETNWECN